MGSDKQAILQAKSLCKSYRDSNGSELCILENVDLTLFASTSIALVGASGSGKTTLLQILGGLLKPTSGEVLFVGQSFNGMAEKQLCRIRNQNLGFVYQFHHLLPEISALDNVAMPLHLGATRVSVARDKAQQLLEQVGLGNRSHHRPSQLSGGERQRVAIARAMVNQPLCLLADEPTGNLDSANAEWVIELMLELCEHHGSSLVVSTHDDKIAKKIQSIYPLSEAPAGRA